MTVEIKSDGSLFDEFFRLKYEIIKKYGVEPRGDIKNAAAEKMLIEQAYLKGYVDGKAEAMQWIPCSERLPECEWGAETEALMYQVGDTIYTGYFGRGGLWRDEYFRRYADIKEGVDASDVIAWMPLPEPYKEEVDND